MAPQNRNQFQRLQKEANVEERYDIVISQKALIKRGFHKAVTSKSPKEMEQAWGEMALRSLNKLKKSEYCAREPSRHLTTAMLLFRHETRLHTLANASNSQATQGNVLAKILNTVDISGEVANALFAEGLSTVLNAAITSKTSWLALSNCAKIWDFNASSFRTNGNSGVLLVATPECTTGEINSAYALDPYGLFPSAHLSDWCAEAIKLEKEIYLSIFFLHNRIHRKAAKGGRNKDGPSKQEIKNIMPVNFLAEELVQAIKSIRDIKTLWGACQFTACSKNQLFEPPAIFCMGRLKGLLTQVSEKRNSLQVLYFEKVPFLDRRMMAVIVRACPNVRMLGVYACPLIHFGDVLCLIDLIYEVNHNRRKKNLPEIAGFDFYPHYNKGTPFATSPSATYGLTWGPHKLDVVQRGFFEIILKAFARSKRMKLGLLFDEDKAFCKYLGQIPNHPLAVPTFLDGMYRYMEAKDDKLRKRALYDLLKPVRIGLESGIEQDWPGWYVEIMGRSMLFCSSCGHEMLEEFFSAHARRLRPHRRVCAGCTLQHWLDEESDHLKCYKKKILDTLFPKWTGLEFNSNTRVPASVKGIIRIRSTSSVRPQVPQIMVDENGEMYSPQIKTALVRDNKVHLDSLQNLPTLSELLTDQEYKKAWGHAFNRCNNLDIYCRAVWRVHQENREKRGGNVPDILKERCDGGMPDHVEEVQPSLKAYRGISCHDFNSAFLLYVGVAYKGWSGYDS